MTTKKGAWGKAWSLKEEMLLLTSKEEGMTIEELAKAHGRTENAIKLRLGLIASKSDEEYPYIEPEIVAYYKEWKEKKSAKAAEKRSKLEAEKKSKEETLKIDEFLLNSKGGLEVLQGPILEMKKSLRQLVFDLDSHESPQTIEEYEELLGILFRATKKLAQEAGVIQTYVSLTK